MIPFQLDINNAGMVRRIINYSNKNPWLYAVYVVVIGLPLVLIITFCCSGKTQQLENMSDLLFPTLFEVAFSEVLS